MPLIREAEIGGLEESTDEISCSKSGQSCIFVIENVKLTQRLRNREIIEDAALFTNYQTLSTILLGSFLEK